MKAADGKVLPWILYCPPELHNSTPESLSCCSHFSSMGMSNSKFHHHTLKGQQQQGQWSRRPWVGFCDTEKLCPRLSWKRDQSWPSQGPNIPTLECPPASQLPEGLLPHPDPQISCGNLHLSPDPSTELFVSWLHKAELWKEII